MREDPHRGWDAIASVSMIDRGVGPQTFDHLLHPEPAPAAEALSRRQRPSEPIYSSPGAADPPMDRPIHEMVESARVG